VPIFFLLYGLHYLLPSYESHRAITLLNFNLVMVLITFDIMLANMAAKEFMSVHPAFLLLIVPLLAYFVFKVSAQTEIYISMFCTAVAFGIYLLNMTLLAI
jgi:hypothetical protein